MVNRGGTIIVRGVGKRLNRIDRTVIRSGATGSIMSLFAKTALLKQSAPTPRSNHTCGLTNGPWPRLQVEVKRRLSSNPDPDYNPFPVAEAD